MVIWLKKLVYSKTSKSLTLIGIYITTFIVILSSIGMRMIPRQTNYLDSMEFKEKFVKKAGYVRDWIVRYNEDVIFSEVTPSQIDKYIENSGEDISREEAKNEILADRNNYYSTIQNELVMTNKNLDYLAIDMRTGRQETNMQEGSTDEIIKKLTNRSNYLIGNGYYILNLKYGTGQRVSYYSDQYTTDMNYYAGETFEGQDKYRIYVALKEELIPGDDFYVGYEYSMSYQQQKERFYNTCVIALTFNLILLVYWLCIVGRSATSEEIKLSGFDRLSVEVQFIIGLLGYLVTWIMVQIFRWEIGLSSVIKIGFYGAEYRVLGVMLFFVICLLPITITIQLISSWAKNIKNHTILQQIWCYKLGKEVYHTAESKTKTLILTILLVVVNILVDSALVFIVEDYFYSYGILALTPIIIWNVISGLVCIKLIVDYKKILQAARAITEGELDRKVELDITLPMLTEMAETVNSMGTGLEKAVGECIKSERLKTELITNVSHDLKTPLTSIISYIDLLKGENIENATAREYINVLDERSHRLKQLVEDLVEASKAVTGNLKAEVQVLRLDELVGQALGEYQDRMESGGLVVVSDKMQEVWAMADGRHMWRIIENLFSNVCKYAMPQTRVYIEVYSDDNYGYCTIKNISKEPLNIDPNELTERFVRGDASRTTEGSGLGLAIAQSLILIQEGLLDIAIDGDLFKVTIKIPLAKLQEISLDNKS